MQGTSVRLTSRRTGAGGIRGRMRSVSFPRRTRLRCGMSHGAGKVLRAAPCKPQSGSTAGAEYSNSARCSLAKPAFVGCGTALVTPFRTDGSLDEKMLRGLVRRQIEGGIDFLVPCGTTGESPTLTREEHLRVVAITMEEADGNVPVLAGAGGYNTAE